MKHCLVIDDSPVIRTVAQRIFQDLGFETSDAPDSEAALSLYREFSPAVVFLDADMPELDCPALIRAIRGSKGGEAPMILVATTENDIAVVTRALEAGASDFIMKPVDSETIEAKLIELGLKEAPKSASG